MRSIHVPHLDLHIPFLLPSGRLSPFDFALISLSSLHLLFSLSSALYLLHFHLLHRRRNRNRNRLSPAPLPPLLLLLRLNSLWPVRLLLLFLSSFLSLTELLRLPHPEPLCLIYAFSSHSFSQPAFLSLLFFLLRSSTSSSSSSPRSPLSAVLFTFLAPLPFLLLQSLFFLSITSSVLPAFLLPPVFPDRCAHHMFDVMLLGLMAAVYVPLFISACYSALAVVINKRLKVRLYVLVGSVVFALSWQVVTLSLSLLWTPGSTVSQALSVAGFVAMLGCVVVGEVILVVMPVADAMAIAEPEKSCCCSSSGSGSGVGGMKGKEESELELRV